MKKAFVYGLLAFLAITGCQAEPDMVTSKNNGEPEANTQEPSKVFTAIVVEDFNGETKTSLDGAGNVLWKLGDQVSIFAASTVNEHYQVSDASDGKTAATLNKIPDGGFVAGTDIDNNVAFYPYASTAELSKSGSNYVISEIELPSTQNYAAGSFGNGAFPMATVTSSTEDMNLKFKNVLGGLKLQLKGTATITSITVTGNNNEILCGDAEVTITYGGAPSITLSDVSAKTVTLDCGAGVTLDSETATPFIIALPPMTMTGGFTVTVTDSESKQMEIKTTKLQNITRSNLLKMPAVTYSGSFPKKALLPYEFLPNEIDKTSITEAYFHISDPTTTATVISAGNSDYEPIYFEMIGTVAHFYTTAQVYKCYAINFEGWKSLRNLDLSMFDVSEVGSMSQAFMDCHSLQSLNLSSFDTGNVQSFGNMFAECVSLKSLDLSNFNTSKAVVMYGMFMDCKSLQNLNVSSFDTQSVTTFENMFAGCYKLQQLDVSGFDTSSATNITSMFAGLPVESINVTHFNTSKVVNASALFSGCWNLRDLDVSSFDTSKMEDMGAMFAGCRSLKSIDISTFDLSSVLYLSFLFQNCASLKDITMPSSSAPNLQMIHSMFEGCSSLQNIDLSSFDTSNVTMMIDMFMNCHSLKSLDLSSFNVENVPSYRRMFYGCDNLEHLNISSFNPTTIADAEYTFYDTRKLTTLDLGEFDLSQSNNDGVGHFLGELAKHCHIRCTPATKDALIAASSLLSDSKYIWYTDGSALPNVDFENEEGLYCSSDYSKDKTVRTVQLASEGAGIDLVVMGDAYSDRLIDDGTYDADMEKAIDAIFAVEPYKSFKHLFNIYIVYAVSENEVIGKSTALSCFNEGSPIGSGGWIWKAYYASAAKVSSPGECSPVVIMNSTVSDGAATGFLSIAPDYMNDPLRDDYHGGVSEAIAYISGPNDARFDYIVRHEFGHSFGFLMDEYNKYSGAITSWDIESWQCCFAYGMWKNVDLVSDNTVKWAKFINDPRYAGTGIGVYEGALYETGAWRPSPESIMNSTDSGFNAPSREAIYYKIHKLAYGRDWNYNFEDFVTYDLPNINADKARLSAPKARMMKATSSFKRDPVFKKSIVTGPDGKERIKIEMN